MTTLTKTRIYKGWCIFDNSRIVFTFQNIKGYRIDGLDGMFFRTIKQAKSYIDFHLFSK